jgi:hypothetical protein
VTITGSGFAQPADRNVVLFNGSHGEVVSGGSSTLVAKARGCCVGPITVRTPGGGSATSTEAFVFLNLPERFVVTSGDGQSGVAGSALAPMVVQVSDGENGLPGLRVTFAIVSGGGTLSPSQVVTGDDGTAATVLTLPPTPGTVRVQAVLSGFKPLVFTANATSR